MCKSVNFILSFLFLQRAIQMKLFPVLVMLTACAARPQDLSGKMFTFPLESNRAHVRLNASRLDLSSLTLCHRSFTDLKRDHVLFSMATPVHSNDFLIFWDGTNKEIEPHIKDRKAEFGGRDYKPNMWHSICSTWDSESGLVQIWFNGLPSIRKFVSTGTNIVGPVIIILGQEQDSHGGGFDIKQSFVGMMSDVHLWDHILSSCEIQNYVDELNFTPGNVLNWSALEFEIIDRVLIENKLMTCH
ncbi:mucosal pentraxin-like [Neolamprologus brichardi]|nr:mucosal pentraxin-like [Neolamprologus brichardi]